MQDFSVVVTTIGRDLIQLERTLSEIKNSKSSTECVLVIDGNNEIIQTILRNLNVKTVVNQEKLGPFSSFVAGVNASENQFVAKQDDDDPVVEDRIRLQTTRIKNENKHYSICPVVKINKSGKIIPQILRCPEYKFYSALCLLLGSYGGDASLVVSKDHFLETNPESYSRYKMADWAWSLDNLHDSNLAVEPQVNYLYLQHINQITRQHNYSKFEMFKEIYEIWLKRNIHEGLPHLELREAFAISIGSHVKSSGLNIEHLENWIAEFELVYSRKLIENVVFQENLKEILTQKLIIIYFANGCFLKLAKIAMCHIIFTLRLVNKIALQLTLGKKR